MLDPEILKQARKQLAAEGGRARQASMTPKQRSEHARYAVSQRWHKHKPPPNSATIVVQPSKPR